MDIKNHKVIFHIFFCLLLFIIVGLSLLTVKQVQAADDVYYLEEDTAIKVGNSFYEVSFDQQNGTILYILDKSTGDNISAGNNNGILWWAFLSNGQWIDSSFYEQSFNYQWNHQEKELRLDYNAGEGRSLDVGVSVSFSEEQWFKMKADVNNQGSHAIQNFSLPFEILVEKNAIKDAIIPMKPGVKLSSSFFKDDRSYTSRYPGVMFADYLAVNSSKGKIALYSQQGEQLQPADIGYRHASSSQDYTRITRNYMTWITSEWKSPTVVVHVGNDYNSSILAYRKDNRIDQFPNLAEKLGEQREQYYQSAMYKLDVQILKQSFTDMKKSIIDTISVPGLIHPVAFQQGGHDHNYPDFLPPVTYLGSTRDFANFVNYAQEQGNLVMPYVNLSWWDTDSPTLSNLSENVDITDITVTDNRGLNLIETYNNNNGYIMNLHHPFVKNRIAKEHNKFIQEIGVDGILEDQWGARPSMYDFSEVAMDEFDPATSYFGGIMEHARLNQENNLMTEIGVDMLAKDMIGFMGTNYLWDILGYRADTAEYSQYYPMGGMLLRDKVLLYQHDLAEETWTKNKDIFRWNLAMGYNFSHAFYTNNKLDTEDPWLDLVGVFQKCVLSNYTDQLIRDYQHLGNDVYLTIFEDYKVYTNWGDKLTFSVNKQIVPPGGALIMADDGSVTAGLFRTYNNHLLENGEHFLIEIRKQDEIKVFKPLKNDTPIFIKKPDEWIGVEVGAYQYDGSFITNVDSFIDGDKISFEYQGELLSQEVSHYIIKENNLANPILEEDEDPKVDLLIKDIYWSPEEPVAGDEVMFKLIIENQGTIATPEGVALDINLNVNVSESSFWSNNYSSVIPPGANVMLEMSGGSEGKLWIAQEGEHVVNAKVNPYKKIDEHDNSNNDFVKLIPEIRDASVQVKPLGTDIKLAYALKTDKNLRDDQELERFFATYVFHEIEKTVVGNVEFDKDLFAKFGLLWDDDYLYLLADVIDDTKTHIIGRSVWQNDSVELYLDMSNSKGDNYLSDSYQYMLGWDDGRPQESKHSARSGVELKSIDTEEGYRIFAAFPWDTLDAEPELNLLFGLDVAVNDNDTGDRDKQIIWNSFDEQAWQYPNRFGEGKLIEEEKPDLRIVDIKWEPKNAKKGDKLEFTAEIINQGTAATPDGVVHRVDFQIDEQNLFWSNKHMDSIAPGERVILQANDGQDSIFWLLTEGQHIITASIDNQDKIEEINDANNDFKLQINLQ